MTLDRRKLKRAQLIQRVRNVERTQSAVAASDAESSRIRLTSVAERTRSLAAHYAIRTDEAIGADLRSGKAMQDQLQKLSQISSKHAEDAEQQSRIRREALAQSDLRLQKASENTRDLTQAIVANLERR